MTMRGTSLLLLLALLAVQTSVLVSGARFVSIIPVDSASVPAGSVPPLSQTRLNTPSLLPHHQGGSVATLPSKQIFPTLLQSTAETQKTNFIDVAGDQQLSKPVTPIVSFDLFTTTPRPETNFNPSKQIHRVHGTSPTTPPHISRQTTQASVDTRGLSGFQIIRTPSSTLQTTILNQQGDLFPIVPKHPTVTIRKKLISSNSHVQSIVHGNTDVPRVQITQNTDRLAGRADVSRPKLNKPLSSSRGPPRGAGIILPTNTEVLHLQPEDIHDPQVSDSVRHHQPSRTDELQETTKSDTEIAAEEERQAVEAKYTFRSEVNDPLSDSAIFREEKREDGAVEGSYSYSDGFFKRTVRYRADHLGYRLLSEEVEPLGDGPKPDPEGIAQVVLQTSSGVNSQYSVSSDDICKPTQKSDGKEIITELPLNARNTHHRT